MVLEGTCALIPGQCLGRWQGNVVESCTWIEKALDRYTEYSKLSKARELQSHPKRRTEAARKQASHEGTLA